MYFGIVLFIFIQMIFVIRFDPCYCTVGHCRRKFTGCYTTKNTFLWFSSFEAHLRVRDVIDVRDGYGSLFAVLGDATTRVIGPTGRGAILISLTGFVVEGR